MSSKTKKLLVYIFSFLLVVVLYSIKRSFGTVSGALQETLAVNRSLLMLIPAAFSVSPVMGAILGPFVDRNPIKWLFIGGAGVVIGFLGCAFNVYNYPLFLSFAVISAFCSTITYYGTTSFAARPVGFGKAYDFIPEGLSRSLAPVIFSIPAFTAVMKLNVSWVFVGLSLSSLLLVFLFFFSVRKLTYKPNKKAPIIIHNWIKEKDFWANMFAGVAFESSGVMLGANFMFIFKAHMISAQNAVLLFLILFCGFNALGRVFWAWFGWSISTRLGVSLGIVFIALGMFCIPLGLTGAYIGLAFVGFGGGTGVANTRAYIGDRYGQEQIMSRVGSYHTVTHITSATLVWLSGLMYDVFGSYTILFWTYACIALAVSIFFLSEKNILWANKINSKKGIYC